MSIKHTSEINKYAYYVHYRAENYIKQQSLPQKDSFTNYAQKKIKARAGLLKSKISKETKEEYAKIISMLYGRNSGSQINLGQKWGGFYSSLMAILNDKFDSVTDETYMIKESGKIVKKGQSNSNKSSKRTLERQYLTIDQIKSLTQLVEEINLEVKPLETKVEAKKLNNLKTILKKLTGLLNKANEDINKGLSDNSDLKNFPSWKRFYGYIKDAKVRFNLNDKKLLNDFNESLVACGLAYVGLSAAQGFAGEAIGAVAAEMLVGLREKALDEYIGKKAIESIIQKNVVGGQQTRLKYKSVGPEESWLDFLKEETIKNGNTIISKRSSQQKIDITVNLPEQPNIPQITQKVNISMKSVDLNYDIGIVSGTNLWYLIQDEDVKGFLRPYLNVTAARWGDSGTDITQNIDLPFPLNAAKEGVAAKKIKNYREDALNAVKIITAYKALSGDTFGRNAANLFVVNDVAGKQTYVLEINDIIKAILNTIKLKKSNISEYFSFSHDNIQDIILKNTWQESLHERMRGILQDAHSKKINIALKPIVLKSELLKSNKITG